MSPIKLLLLCLGLATAFNNLAAPRPAIKPRAHVVAAVASWYDKGQRLDGTFFDAKASNLEWEAAGNLHDFWDAAGGAPRRVQLCYRPHHTTRTPRAYL